MTGRTKEWLAVVALAAGVACLVAWFAWHRGTADSIPMPPVPEATAPNAVSAPPSESTPGGGGMEEVSGAEHVEGPVSTAKTAIDPSLPTLPDWVPQPEVEFGPADFAEAGRGVVLDLGQSRTRVGQEFKVIIYFDGPPLMLMVIGLGFDPAVVQVVHGSARPVGNVFRTGIEFYADNAKGQLVLLQSGSPGMKNVNRAKGEPVATFRMRGKAEGSTSLTLMEKGSTFVNGKGEDERASLVGGTIAVLP